MTVAALNSIEDRARQLARVLEDVYVLAYDQPATGESSGRTRRLAWYLDEQGLAKAKEALADLANPRTGVPAVDGQLGALASEVFKLFRGPREDSSLRGTLLGEIDPRTGDVVPGSAKKELDQALEAKRRRDERGEYSPARGEPQPRVPRWRG